MDQPVLKEPRSNGTLKNPVLHCGQTASQSPWCTSEADRIQSDMTFHFPCPPRQTSSPHQSLKSWQSSRSPETSSTELWPLQRPPPTVLPKKKRKRKRKRKRRRRKRRRKRKRKRRRRRRRRRSDLYHICVLLDNNVFSQSRDNI